MASAVPLGKVSEIKGDGENGEGKRTKNGQDLGKKWFKTTDMNFTEALSRSDKGMTEEDDDEVNEEENDKEDDVLEDQFESEVSRTAIETERSKEEISYRKRPFEEALSRSDNRTKEEENVMVDKVLEDKEMKLYVKAIVLAEKLNKSLEVKLDILFEEEHTVIDNHGKKKDEMTTLEEAREEYARIMEKIKQKEFIVSILEDAQRRRGKKIDGKVMKVLLRFEQHFDDDCLGKSPVVDKIERFRKESGFMKTIFEDRIYDPWPPLDRNKNKSSNVERKQIILSRKERLMTIDKDSNLGKLEQEAWISRLWEKFKRDDKDR